MTRSACFSVVLPLVILTGLGVMSFSGCGGGANADVTVSFMPAEADDSGEKGTSGGGDTKAAPSGDPGSLVGKITLTGSFGGAGTLSTGGKDPEVCGAGAPIPDETLVVGDGNGVRDVFIYMDKVPKALTKLPAPEGNVVFDQKNCTFLPHALVVRTDQEIAVWNSDAAAHNTHTKPKINSEFNSVVKAEDKSGTVSFSYKKSEKEPVRVVCDFHSWMVAWHLPLDHPFAAVTNPDGTFEIKNIPPGKYRFKVYHSGKYLERKVEVEIKSGAPTQLDLSYAADKLLANR